MELPSAKEDGYLPGLTYLDTARGINPIIKKLPYGLQKNWISKGFKSLQEHHGQFPPFSFFTRFVCYEARIRNDPSFALTSNSSSPLRRKKTSNRYSNMRAPIFVHKTRIFTAVPSSVQMFNKASGPK